MFKLFQSQLNPLWYQKVKLKPTLYHPHFNATFWLKQNTVNQIMVNRGSVLSLVLKANIDSVVCCCTLNKTRLCDEHLFDKLAQTQVIINWRDTAAPSVHQNSNFTRDEFITDIQWHICCWINDKPQIILAQQQSAKLFADICSQPLL